MKKAFFKQFIRLVTFDDTKITVSPAPARFIKQGLRAVLEHDDPRFEKLAFTDLLPGVTEYKLPPGKIKTITAV